MPPLMPDEDRNFGGSLVLDFGKWWRHAKTIYFLNLEKSSKRNSCVRNIVASDGTVTANPKRIMSELGPVQTPNFSWA